MSENGDFWKKLHAKRSKGGKTTKKRVTPPRTEFGARSSYPVAPKKTNRPIKDPDPFAQADTFLAASKPKPPTKSRRDTRKNRFTVTIDMVNDENREKIRFAARSEGRSLSQWARRILLQSAEGKEG